MESGGTEQAPIRTVLRDSWAHITVGMAAAAIWCTGVGFAQNAAVMVSGFVQLWAVALVAAAGDHWGPAAAILVFLSLFTAGAGVIAPRMSVDLPEFKH